MRDLPILLQLQLLVCSFLLELCQFLLHSDHVLAVGSQEVLLVLFQDQIHPVVKLHHLLVDGLSSVFDFELELVVDVAD